MFESCTSLKGTRTSLPVAAMGRAAGGAELARVYAKSAVSTKITARHATAAAIIQLLARRFWDSRRRRSASLAASLEALAREADCHSRKTSSAAAPKMTTKKNTSL